jgi:hypothetical protein
VGLQTVTITNQKKFTLTITAVTVSGAVFGYSGLSLPLSLAPGQSLSFSASFTPTSAGAFNGSMVFSTANHSATTTLTGTGVTGVTLTLQLTPTSLSFGNIVIGDNGVLPVTVTNTGTGSVTISGSSVSGSGYSLSNLILPLTLAAGQSSGFSVTFSPPNSGTVNGSASLTSNATNSPSVEVLSGAGIYGHSVNLSWTASGSSGVTGYNVFRSQTSGGPYVQVNASAVPGTSYVDSDVAAGQTYYYVATSVGSGSQQSGYSNQATANVPSP